MSLRALPLTLAVSLCLTTSALAQDGPTFGMEFEFAGSGNRITNFEEMPFKNYKDLMRVIVEHYGGDPRTIKRVDFEKKTGNLEKFPTGMRPLFRAEWKDPQGRKWLIEPEFVASTGLDGYELVTPPLKDPADLANVLKKVQNSGLVRTGRRSGVHLTIDGKKLIKANGDAKALANLIVMHENYSPMLRRMFNPVRGGGHDNYFARSLSVDHPDLIKEIAELPANQRTKAKLEEIFGRYNGREAAIHEVDPMDPTSFNKPWKYRDMNLAKALNVNEMHDGNMKLVEFRMFDLADPETHKLEADLYRRMVSKATELAAAGRSVPLAPRANMPAGEDPMLYNTPNNPTEAKAKAREMIETLGLDAEKFDNLLERNIKPRELRTPAEFEGMLNGLPNGRVTHDGKAFTYGFELEGRGSGLVNIATPTDAATARRWNSMSEAAKKAYYRQVVGDNHSSVKSHFKLDTAKHPWLNSYWYVEGSGNWEIHSNVMENIGKIAEAMRTAKSLTGKSAKGYHLHMRDNKPDWEMMEKKGSNWADFVERASNWVYLKRVERLRTDLSLKSWSNARIPVGEINDIANLNESDRATIRIAGVERGGSNEFIDVEIRGFTTYVDDIERLGKIFTHQLKTGEFGTWKHTENPMPSEAWGEAPKELRFTEHMEKYLKEVSGQPFTPERRAILEGLQGSWADRAGGDSRAYGTGVGTPLLNWANEASLPESVRYNAKFATEEYLGWLGRYSDRIQSGEFGIDMNLVNEAALTEKLGLTQAEAEALIAYRRANGGKLTAEQALKAIALRNAGTEADASKIDRAGKLDLKTASPDAIKSRLGVTPAKVKTIVDYRDAHESSEAMRKAGFNAAKRRTTTEKSAAFDVSNPDVTAQKLANRTGLSLDAAKRVVAFRDANDVSNRGGLKGAGLDVDEIEEVLGLVKPGVDISNLSASEIASKIGITENQARKLVEARTANRFTRWSDVTSKAGLSEAALRKLRASVGSLTELNRLTADQLVEKAGITSNQADALTRYRDKLDINKEEVLRRVLGRETGNRAASKVLGMDLKTATYDRLTSAGVDYDVARKITNHRDAHLVGRATELSPYRSEVAEDMLTEKDVLNWNEADKLERATRSLDLAEASETELKGRFGLSEKDAKAFLAMRDAHTIDANALKKLGYSAEEAKKLVKLAKEINLKTARVVDIMNRTGLTRAKATKLKELAKISGTATVDQLVEAGLSREKAKRLVEFRTKAAEADGIKYPDVVRKLRLRVRKWVRESGLSEALLHSLLPRADVIVTRNVGPNGQGFASVVRAKPGAFVPSKMSYDLASGVFSAVRDAALESGRARLAGAGTDATVKANLTAGLERLQTIKLEIIETNDIRADYKNERVRVSTGLLNAVHARADALPAGERAHFRARVLGLIMGHETAHGMGLKSEKLADMEAVKIVESARGLGRVLGVQVPVGKAEIAASVEAFKPTSNAHVDGLFTRLKNYFKYGKTTARTERMERTAAGEVADKLAKYRRADGTLEWKKLTKDRTLREGVGLAHFGLALFLKELAVVAETGDRARIEEFFDGLLTTDFYKEYGLFVVGARVGEVAYVKHLQKYVKPRFVNGILKSNLVLATGLALPAIVRGDFSGKAFAITLGSLGLSSTAVKTGAAGIKWLIDLKKAKNTGAIAKAGLNARRLAKLGGWFYTAVELAVVLYAAEHIEHAVNAHLDRRAVQKELAAAGAKFTAAAGDPNATPASIKAAAETYDEAWTAYRDYLYAPLEMDEALFASRLQGAAREAKIAADRHKATVKSLETRDALRRNVERRYGTLEKYADHLTSETDAELARKVKMYSDSFENARKKHLTEIYDGNKRKAPFLENLEHADWLLLGGGEKAAGDPFGSRTDLVARLGRERMRSNFEDALGDASRNRLEAYDDERAVVSAVRAALARKGKTDLADALDEAIVLINKTKAADDSLAHGKTGILDMAESSLTEKLESAGNGGD